MWGRLLEEGPVFGLIRYFIKFAGQLAIGLLVFYFFFFFFFFLCFCLRII